MVQLFTHKTSLGQNFLVNPEVIERSLAAAALTEKDVVLEVGPGQGVLTRRLLASPCRFLHALEIDERLSPWLGPLSEEFSGRSQLTWGDAMNCPLLLLDPRPNKVVANIPYNITTPLIWKILEELAPDPGFNTLVLLVQKEAADRLLAEPGTKDRYPLGVTLELMGSVKSLMKVSPGSFNPPPKVSSALISISIVKERALPNDSLWCRLVRAAFAQRRKKMVNSLMASGFEREKALRCFDACGIPPLARAEELTSVQWAALTEAFRRED